MSDSITSEQRAKILKHQMKLYILSPKPPLQLNPPPAFFLPDYSPMNFRQLLQMAIP